MHTYVVRTWVVRVTFFPSREVKTKQYHRAEKESAPARPPLLIISIDQSYAAACCWWVADKGKERKASLDVLTYTVLGLLEQLG